MLAKCTNRVTASPHRLFICCGQHGRADGLAWRRYTAGPRSNTDNEAVTLYVQSHGLPER